MTSSGGLQRLVWLGWGEGVNTGSGEVSCGSEETRRLTRGQPRGHCCDPGERRWDAGWEIQEEGWP